MYINREYREHLSSYWKPKRINSKRERHGSGEEGKWKSNTVKAMKARQHKLITKSMYMHYFYLFICILVYFILFIYPLFIYFLFFFVCVHFRFKDYSIYHVHNCWLWLLSFFSSWILKYIYFLKENSHLFLR